MTATEAAANIARGAMSAEDYTKACLDRIAKVENEVMAFAHLDPAHALDQARALDRKKAAGDRLGPLHGVPVGIKDIIDTADYPTECGSSVLAGRRPSADATVVRKLREAGAVILGKTVTTEFAYFHPGKTRNPRDLNRTPGGSSSGSAAAVAAGMVPLAIGTQTNGSIIRPGAFCGVFSMKPTHGMVSRAGILELSRSLDHPGPFARSVSDIALAMDVIAGEDTADPDTRPYASPDFSKVAAQPSSNAPVIAFVRTPMWDKAEPDTRTKMEALAQQVGAREVEMPAAYKSGWDGQRTVMSVEMAHNLGRFVERADKGEGQVSQQFRDLVAEGFKVSATHYLAARRDAQRYAQGMQEIFDRGIDAILTPSARGVAPMGQAATGDPVFCTFWSLIGLPEINVPLLANADGLPIGSQLVGARGRDAQLLRTANWLVAKAGSK